MINNDNILNENNYLESKKQVVKNNYWNGEHELILESLQKSCFRLAKEYKQKYFKLRDTLQWYRIPIIIISSLGGFLSLSNSGYIPPEYNKWISLFVGFTNLTVTIISLIESFKKIDTRMNGSYSTFINFQKLHDEISIIKRIPPNERSSNGNDTINDLFYKYESFYSDAPILRKLINDDIGLDEYKEIITPNSSTLNIDIESQLFKNKYNLEKKNIMSSLKPKFFEKKSNFQMEKSQSDSNFNENNNYDEPFNYKNEIVNDYIDGSIEYHLESDSKQESDLDTEANFKQELDSKQK